MTLIINSYMQSSAMADARDLFGSQSNQVLVKDEVMFKPSRNPYQALFEASKRMNAGRDALLTMEPHKQFARDAATDDGLLSANE